MTVQDLTGRPGMNLAPRKGHRFELKTSLSQPYQYPEYLMRALRYETGERTVRAEGKPKAVKVDPTEPRRWN